MKKEKIKAGTIDTFLARDNNIYECYIAKVDKAFEQITVVYCIEHLILAYIPISEAWRIGNPENLRDAQDWNNTSLFN